ncbi:MAG: hypothetical protein JW863_07360 [Chitinispirillaceae bacterium]|nr:hypothetical protein [Chitinispirillaceae bacterium]
MRTATRLFHRKRNFNPMQYETRFLIALLLTTAVETAVIVTAALSIPFIRTEKPPLPYLIGAGIVPSALTLPYFWLVLPAYMKGYLPRIITGECGIFLIETVLILLLTRLPLRYCALLSFLANGASILAGRIIF